MIANDWSVLNIMHVWLILPTFAVLITKVLITHIYLLIATAIGFYTDSISLTSDEASSTVSLSVKETTMTNIAVTFPTTNNSAHGKQKVWRSII